MMYNILYVGQKNSDKPNNIYNLQKTTTIESVTCLSNSSQIIVIITRLEPDNSLVRRHLIPFPDQPSLRNSQPYTYTNIN